MTAPGGWIVPAAWPRLAPERIDCWWIDLDAPASNDCCSPAERERAARFATELLARRFLNRRAAVRAILARSLDRDPGDLAFTVGAHGKPALSGVECSWSHRDRFAVLAVHILPLGIDLEALSAVREPLPTALLATEERAWLEAMPPECRHGAFAALWSAKEAYLKARGVGFGEPLAAHAISAAEDAPLLTRGCLAWRLTRCDVGPDHRCCVAHAQPATIARWRHGAE